MSYTPDIPVEQESSAIKFDLGGLRLDIEGTLEKLKGDSEALGQLHDILLDALEKCSQAKAELDRQIPHD
jgi:hypothetical protein